MRTQLRRQFSVLCGFALLLSAAQTIAQDASFVGTWEMASGTQSLTITQDGDKFKVRHKTPHDENVYKATVSGNTISWTERRPGTTGFMMDIEFKATQDGDTLKGTMTASVRGQFNREFAATRSNKSAPPPTR